MAVCYVYLLPIAIFIWFPATFLITYIIAVLKKDVNPLFPYISDTGTFSPESCIFGQMLNAGAILMALFVYVRHRHVREVCTRHVISDYVVKRDRISLWFGVTAAFGVTVVGNFQETNILWVHMIGAFIAFGLGTVWLCFQTWVSLRVFPAVGKRRVNRVRVVLSLICSLCFVTSFVFAGLAFFSFTGDDMTKWTKKDGGYEFHIVSTITEWIVVFCTMGFILSFTSELREVSFEEPQIHIREKENNNVAPESVNSTTVPPRY